MSLSDGEIHAVAGVSLGVLTGALAVAILASGWAGCNETAEAARDPLENMQAIEASIAYKKAPAKQPQKRSNPRPVEKPQGVSRDEHRKPLPPPDEKDKPKPQQAPDPKTSPIKDRSNFDEDDPNAKPTTAPGEFNDNKRGFAEETKGDPFFQQLAADFHENFEFPKILSASGSAAGCLHLLPDGTIKRTQVNPRSGDDALDDAVDRAVKRVERLRNTRPQPVPTHLLQQATTQWICFKADPQQQQRE
jgi:outer membrane biosynthesis protein TonB